MVGRYISNEKSDWMEGMEQLFPGKLKQVDSFMSLKPRRKASLISHSYFQKSITYRLGVSFPFLLHKLLSEKGKGGYA